MLLSDGDRLKDVVLQLLRILPGVHHQKGQQEHALVLALQLLEQGLCIVSIGGKVRGDDVHVIPGPDGFFLFLNLAAVQLCDGMLNHLDGLGLIHGLNVHGDHLGGVHVQKLLEHLVAEVGGRDE